MPNIVICKPRTLNDEGEDAAQASVTKINITDRPCTFSSIDSKQKIWTNVQYRDHGRV